MAFLHSYKMAHQRLTRLCSCIYLTIIAVMLICEVAHASEVLSFVIEPQDVTVMEGSSALLKCAGKVKHESYKNARPQITWRGPDGQDIGIVGDTFRTQLKNGSLFISSVEGNHGLTGSYQCLLTVDGIGTIVSRSAVVSIAQFPELQQNMEEYFLYPGQTAYFQCITGLLPVNIAYKIQWFKDDKHLILDKVRMIILPNGDLEIDEVTILDKGAYNCNVTFNELSRQSAKTYLDIKNINYVTNVMSAQPEFLVKPHSKTAREGDTIILNCVANGIPKPSIKWLRNGEELDFSDLDSRFTIKGTGSLQISSVQDSDSGNYQCRASNNIESLDAEGMLLVQIPPKFTRVPEDKVANEKEELELECSLYGKPKPMVQWLKNGDIITPNDYMQLVAGHNLRIKGLLQTDAGMFQCIGTNPAGSVQGASQLRIIRSDEKIHQNSEKIPIPSKSKALKAKTDEMHKKSKKVLKNHERDDIKRKSIKNEMQAENFLNDYIYESSEKQIKIRNRNKSTPELQYEGEASADASVDYDEYKLEYEDEVLNKHKDNKVASYTQQGSLKQLSSLHLDTTDEELVTA